MGCLAEDDLLLAASPGELDGAPAIEAHLAGCPACSALVAALVAGERDGEGARDWGALVGRTLGRYRLDAQIGAGGMGAVYRAWDAELRRNVAVKVLTGVVDAAGADRLAIEARAAAAIIHPNVVTVYDVGRVDELAFVVSELVDGESLRSVLAAGPITSDRAHRIGLELARGLAAAHAAGVVHRDLKPENLIVSRDGTLKILDFGLAKLADDLGLDSTRPGAILGTVGYMAPEQARGEPTDARTDLFAVGAVLYELCTGHRAFPGASHAERLTAVLRDAPAGLDDGTVGPLAPVIARCLAKDREARFHSAHDLAWTLERLAAAPGETRPAERRRLSRRGVLVGGGAAAATAALGFALGRRHRGAASAARPTMRQLTFRQGRLMTARFARDGASLFFAAAWDGEPLAIQALRIEGGVARALDLPSADVLAVSRTHLAIAIGRRHIDSQCATGRLAVVPIDGGVPNPLRDDIQDADFSADGAELAVVARGHGRFQLEWPLGVVRLDTAEWITHPRISPDGGRIACLVHPSSNDDAGRMVVIERGGASRTITEGWASIAGLAWSPRGDRVLFTGARDAFDAALFSTSLAGEVTPVFDTVGRLRLHDVTATGEVLISRDVWRLRTIAGGGGVPDVDRSLTPASMVVDMSPDGRSLLIAELADVEEVAGMYAVPAAGGPRLRLGPGWPTAWSPDQTQVLASVPDRSGRPRPVVYAIGGAVTPLAIAPATRLEWGRWIDDDQLVFGGEVDGRPARLWRVSTRGGAAEPLTAEGVYGVGVIDAARRQLAFVDSEARLHVVAAGGGEPRVVPGTYPDQVACGWLGGEILVRTTYTPIEIRRVDPATGAAVALRTLVPPAIGLKAVDSVVLDATAEHYAYSYGQELSELFLLGRPGGVI